MRKWCRDPLLLSRGGRRAPAASRLHGVRPRAGQPGHLPDRPGPRDDWQDLQVGGALCLNFYDVFTKAGVSYRCGFFGPAERVLHSMGHRVELVPGGFRQFAPILARFAPRVMVVQAAPADESGAVNLALHVGATRPELLRAGRDPDRLLIVEVNPNLPRTATLPPDFDNTIPLDAGRRRRREQRHARSRWKRRRPTTSTRPSPDTLWRTSATGRRCRRALAPSPTWWPRSWPRVRWAGSASTPRCSRPD